jgi:hypothetical protein
MKVGPLRLAGLIGFVVSCWLSPSAWPRRRPETGNFRFSKPQSGRIAALSERRTSYGALFGPEAGNLIGSGDPTADQAERARFATFEETPGSKCGGTRSGAQRRPDDWPLPVPIVAGRHVALRRKKSQDEI